LTAGVGGEINLIDAAPTKVSNDNSQHAFPSSRGNRIGRTCTFMEMGGTLTILTAAFYTPVCPAAAVSKIGGAILRFLLMATWKWKVWTGGQTF